MLHLLPNWLVRLGIRRLLAQRLREETARYDRAAYVADLKTRPLAEQTAAANEQHGVDILHPAQFIAYLGLTTTRLAETIRYGQADHFNLVGIEPHFQATVAGCLGGNNHFDRPRVIPESMR